MTITASLVKDLREKTGAGMMDCKKALTESNGDIEKAIEFLRKKGLKSLDKRASKVAAEGFIGMYLHAGGQVGAIVELNCETDFVARGDDFKETANSLAMHVCAMNPQFLNREEVPDSFIEKEKEIILETLNENQKKMADKIIDGKIDKIYGENVFLEQGFIKDDSGKLSVNDVIGELSIKCGEKVTIRRFVKFTVGEGIEKEEVDFASEVASTISGV